MTRVETEQRTAREIWRTTSLQALGKPPPEGTEVGPATQPALSPLHFEGASPSVRFIYACLRLSEAASTIDLARCSGLPPRTVRYAVEWLIRNGFARRAAILGDARRSLIALRTEPSIPTRPSQDANAPAPLAIAC